jgi:hypothetical protein
VRKRVPIIHRSLWQLLLALSFLNLAAAQPAPADQAASTKRMAELLLRIYQQQDWKTDPSKDAERAQYYRNGLQQSVDLRTELKARVALADALLRAGESEGAVTELETLRTMMQDKGILPAAYFQKEVRQLLGVSYLRLGEQENCLFNHGVESCIFPIRGSGIHQLPRGSRGALREFTALLQADPNDLSARWLLNLAHMTLGEYPDKVPAQWLIPEARFASDYDIKRFTDVAQNVGLNLTGHAGGVAMEDFDNDGFLDLMISGQGPLDQLRFFKNNGNGTFTERTKEAGLTGEIGGLNLIHADYNNDGFADVLVLRGGWWGEHGNYPSSLLKNNGNGTFDDVTEAAGLLSFHPTQTAAWADYDNDGWLDLFIGHESNAQTKHPSQLFHNNRNGTFTEVGAKLGLADLGFVKGVAWGDYNNDGRADLYVSIKGAANRLFRNDGAMSAQKPDFTAWKFTDVTSQAGVGAPLHSFATWFWDYDNDGWEDILVEGFYTETLNDIGAFHLGLPHRGETPRLFRNNHDGTFADVTKAMKLDRVILAMGANFGDLDNDGWLDCYFGTGTPEFAALLPNKMFRNADGKTFQDVTTAGGFGHLQKGHGIAFGDLDHDGDEDIFAVIGGAYPGDTYQSVLFENPGHGNHWISIELRGVQSNASAIGARVRLRVETKTGTRELFRSVGAVSSFGGSAFRLHIGLGDARKIKELEIRWPASGKTQRFQNVKADDFYQIAEDARTPVRVRRKPFQFATTKKSPSHH